MDLAIEFTSSAHPTQTLVGGFELMEHCALGKVATPLHYRPEPTSVYIRLVAFRFPLL